jgi:uncharacterized repeat protein (TIGR01451 family)
MALLRPVASCIRDIAARSMAFKSNKNINDMPQCWHAAAAAAALLAATIGTAAAQMSIPGKFAVNAGGAAGYEIPISVPPGIAGMAPALTLEYGSQAGNGILGIGWSLGGLPIIVRCPQTMAQNGARGSINYDGNDRFCLDGQQLVAVSGSYGAEGTEYRTEIESFTRVISHLTAGTTGPAWFEVHTKSGQIMQFGNTSDSQILTPGNPTARSWAVNKVSDTAGNFYTVSYTNDTTNGQVYPACIAYNASTCAGAANSVQFSYAPRPDIIWAYQAGVQLKTTMLLTHVTTYAGSALVADYQLTYQQSGVVPVSCLTGVTLCGGDGTCLPATTFSWASAGDGTFTQSTQNNVSLDSSRMLTVVGDVNGDGKSDLIVVIGNQIVTLLMNGDGTYTQPPSQPIAFDIGSPPKYAIVGGDFNGDGKADFALVGGPVLVTFLSNGNGTYAASQINIGNYGSPPQAVFASGDFNGDGMSDIAMAVGDPNPSNPGSLFTFVSNGNGTWTGYTTAIGNIGRPPQWLMVSGDFNGDGKSDIALIGGTTISTLLSKGDGTYTGTNTTIPNIGSSASVLVNAGDFNGDGKTDLVINYFTSISTYLSKGDGTYNVVNTNLGNPFSFGFLMMAADMNGDGKTDLVVTGGNTLYTFFSNGDGTYVPRSQPASNFVFGVGGMIGLGADFNGDGKGDFLVAGNDTLYTFFGHGGPGNLVTTITNGLGATTSITYQPLTNSNVYSKDTTSSPPTLDVIGPLYVVARVDASNGIGGTYSTTYTYAGAKSDFSGRGFLGFRQMAATDLQTSIVQTTNYRQDFPYVGLALSATKTVAGQTLNQSNNTYEFISAGNGTTIAPGNAPYRVALLSSQAFSWDLDGTAMPTITTIYGSASSGYSFSSGYDAFNNPLLVTVSTPDGYSKTTTNTYYNDTTNWFLGRLTWSQVTATAPSPPTPPSPPLAPDMTISLQPVGTFSQGQPAAYTITVKNSGAGPTTGESVTVEDTLPAGLTASAMSGDGWTCEVGIGSPNCTRSDPLAAGASYAPITLTVNVAFNAPASVTNVVTVSGGGEVNTSNDTASCPTTITTSSGGVRIYLTSGNSWPVPANWNSSHNTVEVIGGGGSAGGSQAGVGYGTGGGGGGYSKVNNIYLTPGATVQYNVGAGGAAPAQGSPGNPGGDTWFHGATFLASSVGARGGQGGAFGLSGLGGGPGGSAALGIGSTRYSGGIGGTFSSTVGYGGGGGAAGPNGNGGAGASSNNASLGGGGGGGNGGGTAGSTTTTTTGGAGGNNSSGSGAGTGGTSGNPGLAGTNGGGGGGGGQAGGSGGTGGAGTEWDASHGSGGGGGQGGDSNPQPASGGSGGLYGAGGGTNSGIPGDAPGAGAQGVIVITYWPP